MSWSREGTDCAAFDAATFSSGVVLGMTLPSAVHLISKGV